ncbi:MAG: stage III sporulation protein AF [Clostridia bacterium]|nr:stage III sporulation protein AF [Clostridia bacterium]
MKGYIIGLCTAAVIAAVSDILAPKEHQKYIRVLLGFLIMLVILSPLPKIKSLKLEPLKSESSENTAVFLDGISQQLKKNVEADIIERLKAEFGVTADAEVLLDIDEEHKIRGVTKISLSKKVPENAVKRLSEVYGCDRIEFKIK